MFLETTFIGKTNFSRKTCLF